MLHCWRVLPALIAILASVFETHALPRTQLEHSPEMIDEDYPDSRDGNLLDKAHSFLPEPLNAFSDGNNNLFDKSHPNLENTEENKMAFGLQKRTSRVISELGRRRRLELPDNLPKNFFLANWEANSRRYRRPFSRKTFSGGNFKLSYPPGKRPYYYSEPEGSEFLGGPGK